MNQQQRVPVNMTGQKQTTSGAFDKRPVQNTNKPVQEAKEGGSKEKIDLAQAQVDQEALRPEKEAFPDIFQIQEQMIQNTKRATAPKPDHDQETIDSLNKSLSCDGKNEVEEDIIKIDPKDLALAEALIFQGYAECDVEMVNFPGRKFTVCSSNAEELSLVDEITFQRIRAAKELPDGSIDLPENEVKSLRNALYLAISYRGFDGKDISNDPICHINTLKRAILKLGDVYNSGELSKANELKENIKKALLKRATLIKRLPTSLIDYIGDQKWKFDAKMLRIMNMDKIVPLH